MFDIFRKSVQWSGHSLSIETGKIARQASSVLVTYGGTKVLCSVTFSKNEVAGDFFPLTVIYQEKFFAIGRIPGGYFKRESKPSESEILISRIIDRSVRPLFPEFMRNEVQIVCEVKDYDGECGADIAAIIGASAALMISGLPISQTIAAARVGRKDGVFLLNRATRDLDMVVSGSDAEVFMIEAEADELSKDEILSGVKFAMEQLSPIVNMIKDFASEAVLRAFGDKGDKKLIRTKEKIHQFALPSENSFVVERAKQSEILFAKMRSACGNAQNLYDFSVEDQCEVFQKAYDDFVASVDFSHIGEDFFKVCWKNFERSQAHEFVFKYNKRLDDRDFDQIREISCETGILNQSHGSALFTRGNTQAFVSAIIGLPDEAQMIDDLMGERRERFMLHYNFPPFAVGEVGRFSGPGRREIGHGHLARRALQAVLPSLSEFSYSVRIVSDISESDGSSSMATICGATAALVDASVPMRNYVAGIAMGVMVSDDRYVILTDIAGFEDALGDMDFKIAGTADGITALQLDIKCDGLSIEILDDALDQGVCGMMKILQKLEKSLEGKESGFNESKIITRMNVGRDRAKDIIGPGGKVIKDICAQTGAKLSLQDNGDLIISGSVSNRAAAERMVKMILRY